MSGQGAPCSLTSLIGVSCDQRGRCALGVHQLDVVVIPRCEGPAAVARLDAGWPERQLAQHIGPESGFHRGQRSPLWGSTLRVVSLG